MSEIITTGFGVAVVDDDTHLSKYILEERRLDCRGSLSDVAARFLKKGDVAVDAGACLGDHTFACLNLVGDTGRVYAFEPHWMSFECLRRNCPKAVLFNKGLSDKPGFAKIISKINIGASYLIDEPGEVELMTLDSLNLPKLDWFKIDVEGMESAVIRGARETLMRCRPILLVELNDETLARVGEVKEDVIKLVKGFGYRMELATPYGLEFRSPDMLFFPLPC